jgi:hypothetical protein
MVSSLEFCQSLPGTSAALGTPCARIGRLAVGALHPPEVQHPLATYGVDGTLDRLRKS